MREEELELIKKVMPNYDDFNLQTSWSMKTKFVFAKPGKKRFVSQAISMQPKFSKDLKNESQNALASRKSSKLPKKKVRILGTADYMAPEVIKGEDVGFQLDFWSLGIIAYEFMTGNLPFNDDTPQKIFNNILNKEIEWPEPVKVLDEDDYQINPIALDFMKKLLTRDPKQRLGAVKGIEELKEHPFLSDVNWQTLITDIAPWIPLGKEADVTNFPNAKEEDLRTIIEEETAEDFSAVKQASMTMKFNKKDGGITSLLNPNFTHVAQTKQDDMIEVYGSSFTNFEGTNNRALNAINQKEADKEMKRVQRLLKKMKARNQ